jgi:hypothetical protein
MLQLAMLSDPDSLRQVSPGIYSTDSVVSTAVPGEQGAGLLATGWLEMADPYRQDSALFIWPALLAAFAAGAGLTAVVNIACKPQRPENRPGCRTLRTG